MKQRLTELFLIALMIVFSCALAYGFETEASYYTYKSCVKEGTSGVWTASGERYDENGFTCASRDFRYGTMLKITNKRNNRSVVVKCNDFGPNKKLYAKGRRIDLSAGAFRAIEDIKKGVAQVFVEVI